MGLKMEHNTISKVCVCWDCPLFNCQSTIVEVDDDMNITEINKVGECTAGLNIPKNICYIFDLISQMFAIIETILEDIPGIIKALVAQLFDDIKYIEPDTNNKYKIKSYQTQQKKVQIHRIQHKRKGYNKHR